MEKSNFTDEKVFKKVVMTKEGFVDVLDVDEYKIESDSCDPPDHSRKLLVGERYKFFCENSTDKLKVSFNNGWGHFCSLHSKIYFCRPTCYFLVSHRRFWTGSGKLILTIEIMMMCE